MAPGRPDNAKRNLCSVYVTAKEEAEIVRASLRLGIGIDHFAREAALKLAHDINVWNGDGVVTLADGTQVAGKSGG